EHLESQSLPGMTIIKLYFHPKANISTALAQTAAATETMMKWLPPGATPPLVIIYSASTVPVIQIGLTSDTMSEQQLFDTGTTFYMKEVAHVRDGFSPQTNIVRANGRRGVIMSILKTGGTSTLEVVSRVKEILQYYSGALPEGLHVTTFFDQSLFVRAAIQG